MLIFLCKNFRNWKADIQYVQFTQSSCTEIRQITVYNELQYRCIIGELQTSTPLFIVTLITFLVAPAESRATYLLTTVSVCLLDCLIACLWTVIPIIDTRWHSWLFQLMTLGSIVGFKCYLTPGGSQNVISNIITRWQQKLFLKYKK